MCAIEDAVVVARGQSIRTASPWFSGAARLGSFVGCRQQLKLPAMPRLANMPTQKTRQIAPTTWAVGTGSLPGRRAERLVVVMRKQQREGQQYGCGRGEGHFRTSLCCDFVIMHRVALIR